jgi:uncharacterized phage protein gp47/JayE
MRTIDSILSQMRRSLQEVNSDLSTFPEYGNLYAIFRAVASSIVEQDSKLDTISSSLFLRSAAGEALDAKANEFNLTRRPGTFAKGSIIVLGTNNSVPSDTILSDVNTGLQFKLDTQVAVISSRSVGTITSTEYTELANLTAGTELYSALFPNLRFIVGTTFNPQTNTYNGNLIGGASKETDDVLKTRISNTITALSLSNIDALTIAARNIEGINQIYIVENEPSIGYITIYIDNISANYLNLVKSRLDTIKPIGTALQVKPFKTISIDINLALNTTDNTSQLRNLITLKLRAYLQNLNPGSTLTKEAIAGIVLQFNQISNAQVINPTGNITSKKNELFSLNNLTISNL